jgi:molybdopterin-guanine dinucleotide biosynthesis protein B
MRVFGFAGWSGSGKTTLIEQVVPHLVARGVRVSLIKHAHHRFDVDRPGKDSFRHRAAGCAEVLVTSRERWALMHERGDREMTPPKRSRFIAATWCSSGYKARSRVRDLAGGRQPLLFLRTRTSSPLPRIA